MTNLSNTIPKRRQALQPVIGLFSCKQIHWFAPLAEHRLFVSVRKATTRSVWLRSGRRRPLSNYARILDHLEGNHSSFFSFRNRAIFAYVDVDQSPLIQKRFHLFNLPSFILWVLSESRPNNFQDVLSICRLKRGKMYRYESTSWKESAFVEFLERGYDKVKAEPVPPEASGL